MTFKSTAIASCKCIFQKCISRKCILFFKSVFLKCVFFESVFVKCVFVKSVFLKCVFVTSVFVKSVFSKKKYFPAGSSGELHSKLSKSTAAQSPPPALKRKWAQIYCTATFLVPFLSAQFYFSQFALSLEIQLDLKKKIWCNFYFKLYDAHIVRPFEVQGRQPGLYQKKYSILPGQGNLKTSKMKQK